MATGAGIPYVPTFGHVGSTLADLAPQAAALYVHVVWEAVHNAARKVQTQRLLLDPRFRLTQALADEAEHRDLARIALDEQVAREAADSSQVWGSLGDIEFDLMSAPVSLDCQEGVTYARHPIIGGKPRLQYTGVELQELRLDLKWSSVLTEDLEARLQALLTKMRDREVLDLVIGDNKTGSIYAGQYVITKIPHRVDAHYPDGRMRSVSLSVDLLEWVDDPDLVVASAAPAVKTGTITPPATAAQARMNTKTGKSQ